MKFSLSFVNKIDELLSDIYCKLFPKSKFFIFLELIERNSALYPDKEYRYIKARLKADYIRNLLGRDYLTIIKILLDKEIIITDNHYIVGEKSKDYWLNPNLLNLIDMLDLETQVEIVINDSKLYNKIQKSYTRQNFEKKFWPIFNNLNAISFDYESAINWLITLVKEDYFVKDNCFNINKFNCYKRMIDDMNDKKWIIVEDEKTGRIFHTFNLIKKELRKFCYVQGQPLVQSDLKSSQPYFLASTLLEQNPGNENILSFFNDIVNGDIYTTFLNRFKELNGSLTYTEINLQTFEPEVKEFKTRDDIKPEFLKILYKGNKGGAALLKVFKTFYPEVYNKIKEAKRDNKISLPIELQAKEAIIFIGAYNELKNDIWVLPCHDSLYTIQEDKEVMINKLKDMFNKFNYNKYKLL